MPKETNPGMFTGPDNLSTLCWCMQITRKDGVTLGFTNLDVDVDALGVTHSASTGFTSSALAQAGGLEVPEMDVEAIVTGAAIDPSDIRAGLFSGAEFRIFELNYETGEIDKKISGWLGPITLKDHVASVRAVGLASKLFETNIVAVYDQDKHGQLIPGFDSLIDYPDAVDGTGTAS